MQRLKFLIVGLVLCINAHSQANGYNFEQVTANTGITFNAINTIIEDKYGFIWFGSNNGLYYYNSSEVIQYNFDLSKPNAPRSNTIRYLYKDKTQKLWLCTDNGIAWFNEQSNTFNQLNFTNTGDFNKINATLLHHVKDDFFLAIINSGLYKFNLRDLILERVSIVSQTTGLTYFTSDESGNLYFAAHDGNIYKADSLLNEIKEFYKPSSRPVSTLSFINNQLWIGFNNDGVEVISSTGEKLKVLKETSERKQGIISNRVRRITEGPNGDIWIGMSGGITVLNPDGNQHILPTTQNGLPHDGIFDLFLDSNGGVWVGTWSGGLTYHHELNYKFPYIQNKSAKNEPRNSVISSFAEDDNGAIWVGSENHGLYLFNSTDNTTKKWASSPVQRIKSIAGDKEQRLWIGTFFEGLWLKEGEKITHIGEFEGIFSTLQPTDKGIWIGQRGGGAIFYNEKLNTIENFKQDAQDSLSLSSNLIWKIFKDSKDNIWFATDDGISVKYKNNNHFTNYYKETHGLSSNLNYTLAEDNMGNIWIGTAGAGIDIFNPNTNTFSKFGLNELIKDADIYCILKDQKGNIWFSSNQGGIYAYYQNAQDMKVFTREDGLLVQQFHPNSGFASTDGYLYFGGGNGFNIIDPEIVKQNTLESEIFLSKLTVNNQNISKQKPKFINAGHLPEVNEVELNYNQNTIGVAFVVNSYIKDAKSKFKYRLENYIDEWHIADYNSNISFTKIPPGKYILQVEYLNSDGLNIAPKKEFLIKIIPPFWLSWYAYLAYFLLTVSIILIAIREVRFRAKSKIDQILFGEKVKFFTNVSHEFRTPLTLIISPINTLIKKYINDDKTVDNLKIIQRNADRLLRLTNQILDFRLIEIGNVKLKRESVDIIALCKNVYDCFEFQINEKEINCIFNSSFKTFELHVDSVKIEKVIYNIMSNALKYSDENGQIILSIQKNTLSKYDYADVFSIGNEFSGDALEVKIKNNGKGINRNILNQIFERFFIDAENTETGTGIGLHICQEYIRMHNGNIMVESEPGKETVFTVNIPIVSQTKYEKENIVLQSFFDRTTSKTKVEHDTVSTSKPVILFAEDNNELRIYYKQLLSSKYKVISAKNGTQAFEIASELKPNLIISDILMPGMDGMSLTEQIRNNEQLSHIPIILLTALSDNKFQIESMHKGANAFLTKPVEEELLFAKIDSVLSNAEIVRKKYKKELGTSTESLSSNQTFIEKVEEIVEKNLQNQSFEITELASQIGTSRSSLQRKIKKTVNMSPSEFIREIRLKKAVGLLKNGEYNIDEIAVIVGFNSTSYFIRSFKKKYEMTPTAFKQNIDK